MNSKKRYRKEILLNHWIRITKELFPHRHSENPFAAELEESAACLTLEQKLLFHDLIHSITLINAQGRENKEKQLISTESDFLNALQLITPKEHLLTNKVLEAHRILEDIFQDQPFTYVEAGSRLKASKSKVKRLFKPLLHKGLITKLSETKEKKGLFQVNKIEVNHENDELDTFETMQGEWKDFIGFVEL